MGRARPGVGERLEKQRENTKHVNAIHLELSTVLASCASHGGGEARLAHSESGPP